MKKGIIGFLLAAVIFCLGGITGMFLYGHLDYFAETADVINENVEIETDTSPQIMLKNYAKNNIFRIVDNDTSTSFTYSEAYRKYTEIVYTNIKYMFADVTGDGKNELLAAGISDNGDISYIEVYAENNGYIEKIWSDHSQGYHGYSVAPVRYEGKIYLCHFSYSSGTGFRKSILTYKDNRWVEIYNCYNPYNHETGEEKYIVNDKTVKKEKYEENAKRIEESVLTSDNFFNINEL